MAQPRILFCQVLRNNLILFVNPLQTLWISATVWRGISKTFPFLKPIIVQDKQQILTATPCATGKTFQDAILEVGMDLRVTGIS